INVQAIPYRGSGPAMQDLISHQFDYMCTISGSAAGPLQSDLIKGVAVFKGERLASLPNLPTASEQGIQFEASTWFGFFVPKATPPPQQSKNFTTLRSPPWKHPGCRNNSPRTGHTSCHLNAARRLISRVSSAPRSKKMLARS